MSPKTVRALIPILVSLAAANVARGQDLADLDLETLMDMEVNVTSVSKKSARLADSAAAVTVITRDDLRRLGVTHLDLSESFRGQSDYHFPHDVHWNAKGSAIVADAVEAFLEAQGVFEPRPRQAAQRAPAP